MKKCIFLLLLVFCATSSTLAFSPDNRLLNTLYTHVDTLYETAPERVLRAYQALPYLTVKYQTNKEVRYYLDKLGRYIHGKLFVFDEQPQFVCLDNRVQKGDTVEVNYTLQKADQTLIKTTWEEVATQYGRSLDDVSPVLAFNPGEGQVIPGMDQKILGMQVGKRSGAILEPRDAFGSYTSGLVVTFSTPLPGEVQIAEIGSMVMMRITVEGEEKILLGRVVEKSEDHATVDFNHPLAGEQLRLTIQAIKLFKPCRAER